METLKNYFFRDVGVMLGRSMRPIVRAFAENQPAGNQIWVALAWCVGIMLMAYFFAMNVYKKRM